MAKYYCTYCDNEVYKKASVRCKVCAAKNRVGISLGAPVIRQNRLKVAKDVPLKDYGVRLCPNFGTPLQGIGCSGKFGAFLEDQHLCQFCEKEMLKLEKGVS